MSIAIRQRPSFCLRITVSHLPTSSTGDGAPGGVSVSLAAPGRRQDPPVPPPVDADHERASRRKPFRNARISAVPRTAGSLGGHSTASSVYRLTTPTTPPQSLATISLANDSLTAFTSATSAAEICLDSWPAARNGEASAPIKTTDAPRALIKHVRKRTSHWRNARIGRPVPADLSAPPHSPLTTTNDRRRRANGAQADERHRE